jgi:hypothetical protein
MTAPAELTCCAEENRNPRWIKASPDCLSDLGYERLDRNTLRAELINRNNHGIKLLVENYSFTNSSARWRAEGLIVASNEMRCSHSSGTWP